MDSIVRHFQGDKALVESSGYHEEGRRYIPCAGEQRHPDENYRQGEQDTARFVLLVGGSGVPFHQGMGLFKGMYTHDATEFNMVQDLCCGGEYVWEGFLDTYTEQWMEKLCLRDAQRGRSWMGAKRQFDCHQGANFSMAES